MNKPLNADCPGCGDTFPSLPVVDTESGESYCTETCLDRASERFWMAVWSA